MKTRQYFMAASTLAMAACAGTAAIAETCKPVTDADMMGMAAGAFPQQFELSEFAANCDLTFSENPDIAALNAEITGNPDLPAVADRLPSEPLVLIPHQSVGQYGGTINSIAKALESGTSDMLSWRHVNLVRFSDDLETIVPSVAKSWEWNEDQTQVTFTLRAGHKWSDGAPFTARDIAFWYNANKLNEALYSDVQSLWVYGGEPMQVEALDDTTVRFSFAVPNPNFLTFLATTWRQPFIPQHFLEQYHGDFNENADALAIEAGFDGWVEHFQFLSCASDWKDCPTPLIRDAEGPTIPTLESHITVVEQQDDRVAVANPYFFMVDTAGNQLPYINRIDEFFTRDTEVANLRALDGQVDLSLSYYVLVDVPLFREQGEADLQIQMIKTGGAGHMVYTPNFASKDPVLAEIFGDVRFRQALSVAINRDEVKELVYLGQGASIQWLPADHNSHNVVTEDDLAHLAGFDPDKANALLDEMGLTEKDGEGIRLRSDGKPLVIRLDYSNQAGPVEVHELLRDYWAAIGVRLELKEISSEQFRALGRENDHDLAVWHGDSTDAPGVVGGLSNSRLAPPFREGHAFEWAKWLETDGAEGVEPPADAKRAYEVVDALYYAPIGSDGHAALVRELVDLHKANTWLIGVVGDVTAPFLIRDRVKNVMDYGYTSFAYYKHHPFKPYQWYLSE